MTLTKMYAGKPDTLVIMDQCMNFQAPNGSMANNGNSYGIMLLNGSPGSREVAQRELHAHSKVREEPGMFLVGFRMAPKYFKGFIDPCGEDVYPDALWQELGKYLEGLVHAQRVEEYTFSGGRYGT